MLTVALVLAILYTAAYAILFQKLPLRLRAWLSRRYILLDIFLSAIVLTVLSFTLTGIIAAAMVAILVSVYLWWYKNFRQQDDEKALEELRKNSTPLYIQFGARIYNFFRS